MEGYTAYFCPLEDIYDEDRDPFDLYLGHIELKNGNNILTKFEFNISDIYEEPDFNLDPIYRIPQCNYIEIFLNFVKNLENLGEAKLSFRQRNGERYYSVKGNIFKFHFTDEYFSHENDYIVNESLINAFKEIENIIKSKFDS
jgi:hypothetical protein